MNEVNQAEKGRKNISIGNSMCKGPVMGRGMAPITGIKGSPWGCGCCSKELEQERCHPVHFISKCHLTLPLPMGPNLDLLGRM